MDADRWARLERLYHAARQRPPEERAAFLDEASAGDAALRADVQVLLDTPASAARFLDVPAAERLGLDLVAPAVDLSGKTVGVYAVGERIGAGGMGEVYRARDTKLGRDVALKVLPALFANDPERLARFQREARVLAALNHPHIAQIYGLEQSGGVSALVMELVEGPTLADRIARGPIPVDEALAIVRQIVDGLETAHEQGIVHRDLKPANIKVREDGVVKLLDFGLAKAMDPRADGAPPMSQSPTITTPATLQGTVLGTAAYMAPEQAKGRAVDKRADVWALGCVLYEMLTGHRVFEGDDVSEVFAGIIKSEPDWARLPTETPAVVRGLLRACLQKDVRRRVRDIGDVRLALEGVFETVAPQAVATAVRPSAWRQTLALAAGALATAAIAWALWPTPVPGAANRFDYHVPEDQVFRRPAASILAVAPDGRSFVYNTQDGLYLRPMGELEGRLIRGTEEVLVGPFFSADGQSVGYFVPGGRGETGQLKRIATSGGAPVPITDAGGLSGATWTADGEIFFGQQDGIHRVAAAGGTSELVIAAEPGERVFSPQLLPDKDSVLFTVTTGGLDEAQIVVESLSTHRRTPVVEGSDARYLPTGHLVYALDDVLLGVAFDVDRLIVMGPAEPLEQGLRRGTASANYGVSDDGTLVYLPAGEDEADRVLQWVGPNNQVEPVSTPPGPFSFVRLSPNGQAAAVTTEDRNENGGTNIRMTELDRGSLIPIMTEDGSDNFPLWTRNSERIVFSSIRGGRLQLRWRAADGSDEATTLVTFEEGVTGAQAYSWSQDGSTLAFAVNERGPVGDIGVLSVDDPENWRRLIETAFDEDRPMISPNGRMIAWVSDETGEEQVYVRPFPGPGLGKRQVSLGTIGHHSPTWSPDGQALLFLRGRPADALMRATIGEDSAGVPAVGQAEVLFPYSYWSRASKTSTYDVAPDGRVLVIAESAATSPEEVVQPPFVIVQNWFEELKRRVPTE